MLSHYLRSAWRTIRRNPFYSGINIGCLAIGIAVSMTVLLYVLHEHSYDQWQKNAKRLFAVSVAVHWGAMSFNTPLVSWPSGQLVQKADGNVEAWLRILPAYQRNTLSDPSEPGKIFSQEAKFIFADSTYFRLLTFRLVKGNPAAVLSRPYTVVLTETAAKKYFGDKDPIGRTLRMNDLYNFEVTGVAADLPSNTDFSFNAVASMSSISSMTGYKDYANSQSVQAGAFLTWLLLKQPGDSAKVVRTLDRLAIVPGQPSKDRDLYKLTSLADHHLRSDFGDANLRYLKVFPLAAGLILLLVLVNYMSLATARATARAKEVGVRKVIGAGRSRIAAQFYAESAVFALLSFVPGTMIFLLIRPFFFRWLEMPIDTSFLLSPVMLLFSGGLLLTVILTAGSYPSLVLSAFRPVVVLYGKMSRRKGGERIRKGFIVLQFAISMTLVLSSVIIEKELYYVRHADTGINRENLLMVPFDKNMSHYGAFKQEVASVAGIRGVATAQYPLYKSYDAWAVKPPGADREIEVHTINADQNLIPLLGIRFKEPPIRETDLYDGDHMLVNETAVTKMALSGDPVGQKIKMGNSEMTIAAVVKDFNYQSLQSGIQPLFIFVQPDSSATWNNPSTGCLMGKIEAHANIPTIVDAIRKIFRRYDRQSDFDYSFADDAFDQQYKAEDRLAGLLGVLMLITIVVACLGLFGLATFSARRRVREIGIRKVLGASAGSIGALLSKDFLRPVLLAVLIASPVSWWMMNRWLQDFAYRTPLSWWVFVMAGLGLLGIALVAVLMRSLKAGRANPVDNLRTD